MALNPKQARCLERFFQGLIAAVKQLGPGEFMEELPIFRGNQSGIIGITLDLTYHLNDQHIIEIKQDMQRKRHLAPYAVPPQIVPVNLVEWEHWYYRLHYGRRLGNCCFRFDLTQRSGHHVHMFPDTKLHVPTADVEPDVRNLDPREFIKMVAAYRSDGKYPVWMKKS